MRMMMNTNSFTLLQTYLFLILLFESTCLGHSELGGNGANCRETEQMALLQFKAELIDVYGRLSSWRSFTNCCEWKGVVCDNRTDHVVALHLRDDEGLHLDSPALLGGKISPSLFQLSHLQYLDLSFNDFHSIPTRLGNLSGLRFLDLSYNAFYLFGAINLDWLSGSQSLQYLDLSGSNLEVSATWLQVIHNLTALQELHLSYCQLPQVAPIYVPSHNPSNSLLVLNFLFTPLDHSTAVFQSFLNMSSSFTYIDFSHTSLSGIPNALGNLVWLSHLNLRYNSLKNNIPDFLWNLTSLSFLDLSFNELQGVFPRTSTNSSSLTHLGVSWNNFNGQLLPGLQDFTRLEYLSLSYNLLSGSFPNMSRFTLLKELHLDHNGLQGALLEGRIRLPNLEILDLSRNKFEGRLPDLSTCQPLRVLSLSENAFNGSLSQSIEHLSKIKSLHVGYNQFEGVFNLSNHPQLTDMNLTSNLNLTLTTSPSWIHRVQFVELHLENIKLGPSFPTWLQKQNQLTYLDISNSEIFDTIPAWFWGTIYKCSHLNMSHNHIYGVLPNLSSKFQGLNTIDLSSNEFNGPLPHLPPLVYNIDMSRNRFSGEILSFCSFRDISLFLDVSNNQLSGEIPQDCFMNLLSLTYLNLANNNFSGEISTTNNKTCRVLSLHLRNNSFIGEIPKSLMNCWYLRVLDLGGNEFSGKIPRWLVETMPYLRVLILKSNMLSGSLPASICHLANIQVLDISLNKVTGTIPSCMDNFNLLSSDIYSDSWSSIFSLSRNDTNNSMFYDGASVIWKGHEVTYFKNLRLLKMIDLSSNDLTGEIPPELTTLIGLVGLNLSGNKLVGLIPTDIDELRNLDFLDLSRNNLTGNIPPSLSKLNQLGMLDLSFNNLSGKIPWDSHMQTFEASSFSGNQRLCGPPLLLRPCPEDEKPSNGTKHSEEEEEEVEFMNTDFYISLLLGFFVAFWVVFWTSFFNKWWNAWSMKTCTTMADWLYVQVLVNKRRFMMRFFGNA